jgi:acyl dehydratase
MIKSGSDLVLKMSHLHVGQVHEQEVVRNLSRVQIVQYAGASGDFNPLHVDETYATEIAGYPTTIAHGMLTMGLTGHMLTDFVGDGLLTSFGGRFVAVVYPGDTLIAKAEIIAFSRQNNDDTVELNVTTENSRGEIVFRGRAKARIEP